MVKALFGAEKGRREESDGARPDREGLHDPLDVRDVGGMEVFTTMRG